MIHVIGSPACIDTRRAIHLLEGLGMTYQFCDVDVTSHARQEILRLVGRLQMPLLIYPDGTWQVTPRNGELIAKARQTKRESPLVCRDSFGQGCGTS
ncbi:MAG: glutaredoxin family protein [Candidatus Xenobia bacterium]